MTTMGLLIQLKGFYDKQDWFLFTLDLVVLIAAIVISLECSATLSRSLKARKTAAEND